MNIFLGYAVKLKKKWSGISIKALKIIKNRKSLKFPYLNLGNPSIII